MLKPVGSKMKVSLPLRKTSVPFYLVFNASSAKKTDAIAAPVLIVLAAVRLAVASTISSSSSSVFFSGRLAAAASCFSHK